MDSNSVVWEIYYTNKIRKCIEKLPPAARSQAAFLIKEMEIHGPYQKSWPHYSPLSKKPGILEGSHHCHIKSGRPTYVVCWRIADKKFKKIEVFYVGTHEGAPY